MNAKPLLIIIGPTASGKSSLALRLAQAHDGEIVSCDSVQVYRGFDLGAAKPTKAEQRLVGHHLIDVVDPSQEYDAGRYAKDATQAINEIWQRQRLPIVVGGTGLYLRSLLGDRFHEHLPRDTSLRARLARCPLERQYALLQRLDPERAAHLHPNDRVRIERALELRLLLKHPVGQLPPPTGNPLRDKVFTVYIEPERVDLKARIVARTEAMVAAGLVNEVKDLLKSGVAPQAKPMQSIGYLQVCQMLQGQLAASALVEAIAVATSQYAKRQRTWFRKVQKDLVIADGELAWVQVNRAVEQFVQ